jgi:hypothetical protein
VNVEQGKHRFELIEAITARINAKTQKLNIRKLEKYATVKSLNFHPCSKSLKAKATQ